MNNIQIIINSNSNSIFFRKSLKKIKLKINNNENNCDKNEELKTERDNG